MKISGPKPSNADLALGFVRFDPSLHADIDTRTMPHQLRIPYEERRKSHMLVLGAPGSGKSKLLESVARHDISARRGLCILDIHGTLYQDVKRFCAHNYFLTRGLELVDPSSGEYVRGVNLFRRRTGLAVDVQVAGMVQALLRVWGAETSNDTPTLDRVLRLLFTAMISRDMPLHEAFRLVNFSGRELRDEVIRSFADSDEAVRMAWEQLQSLKKAGEWRAEVLSTENRLFRLVSSPTIRRFMGVMDPAFNLDIRQVMNRGQILLVNLKESRHLSEDNARAFAALLVNELFKTAIMFRDPDTLGCEPAPFFLYIDEWQNFVTPDIRKILAQARKFGLLLVLANQDLAQIRSAFSPEFVDTLMTCCPTKACFGGLNRADARRMAEEMLAGQIDLNETKYELHATRFRPEYGRDRVYGDSDFSGSGESARMGDGIDSVIGMPMLYTGASRTRGRGRSVADVPIYRPVEFQERTGRTTYSLDEQLWRWSDRLKEQPQRHFFAKVPGMPAYPVLVPKVSEAAVGARVARGYEAQIAAQTGARTADEVDRMLVRQRPSREQETSAAAAPDMVESLWN